MKYLLVNHVGVIVHGHLLDKDEARDLMKEELEKAPWSKTYLGVIAIQEPEDFLKENQ
jgi:hypothetical protein